MRKVIWLVALLAACAPAEEIGSLDDAAGEDGKGDRAAAPDAVFYSVARAADGAFQVKRIGRSAQTTTVSALDLAALALDDGEVADLLAAPERLIVRGTLGGGTFAVKQAFRGAAELPATVYELSDTGVRCFAAPCFSLLAAKLNSTVRVLLSGLDGALAAEARAELAVGPLLVSGAWRTTADGGRVLAPAQLWTLVVAANPAACKEDSECVATAYSRFVTSPADCYCPACEDGVVNRATAASNQESWERHCANVRLACSGAACVAAPVARCVATRCSVE